jgi:peroxiredoxin
MEKLSGKVGVVTGSELPVVLSFYRGGWCPYCNLELRALQKALPEITRLGARLVAVSPQTPDESLSTGNLQHRLCPPPGTRAHGGHPRSV